MTKSTKIKPSSANKLPGIHFPLTWTDIRLIVKANTRQGPLKNYKYAFSSTSVGQWISLSRSVRRQSNKSSMMPKM